MHEAAQALVGTHDFRAFAKEADRKRSCVRTIYRASVERDGALIRIEVTGSGFLYNMIRIIAGTLIDVGLGRRSGDALEKLDRGRKARARRVHGSGVRALPRERRLPARGGVVHKPSTVPAGESIDRSASGLGRRRHASDKRNIIGPEPSVSSNKEFLVEITVTGRHPGISQEMRTYAEDKVRRLTRIFDRLSSARVTLEVNGVEHRAEASVHGPRGAVLVAHAAAADMSRRPSTSSGAASSGSSASSRRRSPTTACFGRRLRSWPATDLRSFDPLATFL